MEEKYNVTYTCGCVHELLNNRGVHQATGNRIKVCEEHKIQ